ncbi:AsnC family transcriptional regulator [Sphingopyxis bauzanensis]|uniref:AsnC family transcriptional regulator n=1 Tax=Sphingopyxis bauzanensis TaxID=651663 RepID=A0A246JQY4_9SPHN|nr:Lrp/AsnC family transcriptional regulator [Sphingopyxis bauzanensis]OWQ95441.1 AsnC family transcriptional regulator [Sphingopyxis bauzanensis]
MNRSRYIARALDPIDRAICLALGKNARLTIRELAGIIGLSSPSATERMRRLEDSGVISGYTITVDNQVAGQPIGAYFRFQPNVGEVPRIVAMLAETPEMVEADRVTGDHCLVAKAYVKDMTELERLIDRFLPYAATTADVIQSTPVIRRLLKF